MEKDDIKREKVLKNEILKSIYDRIVISLNNKCDDFKLKVQNQKENYLKSVVNELKTIDDSIKNVLENEGKISLKKNMSIEEKRKLKNNSIKTREQIERVSHNLTTMEKFPSQIEKRKINDILSFDGEKFEDLFLKGLNLGEDAPANMVFSDKCRQCKSKLVWGRDNYGYNQKCSFSDPCNNHFRYVCDTCKMKYCTQCAYPHDPNVCGCGNEMVLTNLSYHSCDLCRTSIREDAWRCAACDFDICLVCYEMLTKIQGKINTSEEKKEKKPGKYFYL